MSTVGILQVDRRCKSFSKFFILWLFITATFRYIDWASHNTSLARQTSQKNCGRCSQKAIFFVLKTVAAFLRSTGYFFPKKHSPILSKPADRFFQNAVFLAFWVGKRCRFFGSSSQRFCWNSAGLFQTYIYSKSNFYSKHTADVRNPANQLRLVVYPMIYGVLAPSQVVASGFLDHPKISSICSGIISQVIDFPQTTEVPVPHSVRCPGASKCQDCRENKLQTLKDAYKISLL